MCLANSIWRRNKAGYCMIHTTTAYDEDQNKCAAIQHNDRNSGNCVDESVGSYSGSLTTQAQPRRVNKLEPRSGTGTAPRRWLKRLVSLHFVSSLTSTQRISAVETLPAQRQQV